MAGEAGELRFRAHDELGAPLHHGGAFFEAALIEAAEPAGAWHIAPDDDSAMIDEDAEPTLAGYHPYPATPSLAGYHPYPAEPAPTPSPTPTVNARTEAGWDDASGLPGWG